MKCKRFLFVALVLFTACNGRAQDVKQEINDQVWSPFIQTYGGLDAEGFMAIHTDDVIRVNRDGKSMRIGAEYSKAMHESFERSKYRGSRRAISFSFLERIHTDDYGFEVGYYKVVSASGGQERVSYGKFHVVLKKVDGRWKILVDSDTSLDDSITEEDFMQGEVLVH